MYPSILPIFVLSLVCICNAFLIDEICRQSTNPSLCTSSLKSDPRSDGADKWTFGAIATDKAMASTKSAINIGVSLPSKGNAALSTCISLNGLPLIIDDMKNMNIIFRAMSTIPSDIVTLNRRASEALTTAGTCNDALAKTDEPPKLKTTVKEALDLLEVVSIISSMVSKGNS